MDGFADLLPALPPPDPSDENDMGKVREHRTERTTICLMATCSRPDGEVIGPIIVTERLPTEDFPIEKALAHIAARLADQMRQRRRGAASHD